MTGFIIFYIKRTYMFCSLILCRYCYIYIVYLQWKTCVTEGSPCARSGIAAT